MKADTERKKRFHAKLHKKKDFLHVHLSKQLREKLKTTKRALLVHEGDKVKVMRGSNKGKEGKITKVNHNDVKVFIEELTKRTARGREIQIAFEPSNLLLLDRGDKGKKVATQEIKTEIKEEKTEKVVQKAVA